MEYLDSKERFEAEKVFVKQFKPEEIALPPPPQGFEWIFFDNLEQNNKKKNRKKITISMKLIDSNDQDLRN